MKAQFAIVALALVAFNTACSINAAPPKDGGSALTPGSGTHSGTGAGSNDPNTPAPKPQYLTDTSACGRGTPAHALNGRWEMKYQVGELNFDANFNFANGWLTLAMTCGYPEGGSLTSSVSAPYSDQGNQMTVLAEANHTERLDEGGTHEDCTVSLSQRSIDYTFYGSCLQMRDRDSGETVTLVPVGSALPSAPVVSAPNTPSAPGLPTLPNPPVAP